MGTGRKKKKKKNKIILFTIEIVVLVALLVGLFIYSWMGKVDNSSGEDIRQEDPAMNIELDSETAEVLQGYTNIALFGIDNRESGKYESGNSDCIMIASINNDTKKVKLISVYRDTFLNVKDDTYGKINSAYSKGNGAKGAIAALNKNLNLDIVDYVIVNIQR